MPTGSYRYPVGTIDVRSGKTRFGSVRSSELALKIAEFRTISRGVGLAKFLSFLILFGELGLNVTDGVDVGSGTLLGLRTLAALAEAALALRALPLAHALTAEAAQT